MGIEEFTSADQLAHCWSGGYYTKDIGRKRTRPEPKNNKSTENQKVEANTTKKRTQRGTSEETPGTKKYKFGLEFEGPNAVGKVGNAKTSPVNPNSWGITCRQIECGAGKPEKVLELFSKIDNKLVVIAKDIKPPFNHLSQTFLDISEEESPREIISLSSEMRYLSTNAAVYLLQGPLDGNVSPIFTKASEQPGRFHGLACNSNLLFFSRDRAIIMHNIFDARQTQIFESTCMLGDLTVHKYEMNLLVFALDEEGNIHTIILTPMFSISAFVLKNNEKLDGPLCIAARTGNNDSKLLSLLISNSKQIVEIELDCEKLCEHKATEFPCQLKQVHRWDNLMAVSIDATDREIYFSGVPSLEFPEDAKLLRTSTLEKESESDLLPPQDCNQFIF